MTEKQKQAISLINRLKENISEEEYFLLLEFVVGNTIPAYVPYYPYYPTYPYITYDSKPIPVTCTADNISTSGDLTVRKDDK